MTTTSVIKTINKDFISESIKKYPILKEDKHLRKFYCYLINQALKNKDTILVSSQLLASIENKEQEYRQRNYKAYKLIERFNEKVFNLETNKFKIKSKYGDYYSDYKYIAKKGREIKVSSIPKYLINLLKQPSSRNKVFIDTLKPFNRSKVASAYHRKRFQELEDKSLIEQEEKDLTEIEILQKQFLELVNKKYNQRKFTSIVNDNIEEARALANTLPYKGSREYTLNLLDEILLNPKPIYKPSPKGNSPRIFSSHSYLNLPTKVREVFMKNTLKIDIKSSQLSIVAKWWDLPKLTQFLKEGKSIWVELIEWLGLQDFDSETKNLIKQEGLKKFIYSLIFGMKLSKLKSLFKEVIESILPDWKIKRFKSINTKQGSKQIREAVATHLRKHPIIKELLDKRQIIKNYIERQGGMETLKGWISLKDSKGHIIHSTNSIMACFAQQVEMLVMSPIINLLNQAEVDRHLTSNKLNKFFCLGWLHDGVYIKVADPKRKLSMWLKRFNKISHLMKQYVGIEYEVEICNPTIEVIPYKEDPRIPKATFKNFKNKLVNRVINT